MTDEEIAEIKLAEAWVGENGFASDCNNLTSFYANREMVNAHLAGQKAGKLKWHKVADGDLPNENVKLILVRDRWKNHFLNYHLLLTKMIVEMIDQFDEWVELPIEE